MFSLRAENQPEYQNREEEKSYEERKAEAYAKFNLASISDEELAKLTTVSELDVDMFAAMEQRLRALAKDTRSIEQQYIDAASKDDSFLH